MIGDEVADVFLYLSGSSYSTLVIHPIFSGSFLPKWYDADCIYFSLGLIAKMAQWACLKTNSTTLPIVNRFHPVWPCVPRTIRSALCSSATRIISWPGSPSVKIASTSRSKESVNFLSASFPSCRTCAWLSAKPVKTFYRKKIIGWKTPRIYI